jgi:L,D-peptidoglycan transpeptidase YkuD (ErfK/YbiS/YcfS/YnhG family)
LRRNDGWCEDQRHGRYNCPIRLPSAAGHETMWRKDHLYDLVGVLDWNMRPRIRGRGSAIFLHLARPGYLPTAGCIALNLQDLRRLLVAAGSRPEFVVASKPRKRTAAATQSPPIVGRRKGR